MRSNPNISINLHDPDPCVYYTSDSIRGSTNLVVEQNASLEAMDITLTGKASTRVEKHPFFSNKAAYDLGEHTFLRLSQPVSVASLQRQSQGRGQQEYKVPFEFTIPRALLPYACQHSTTKDEVVRESHLSLPPTLGNTASRNIFINDYASKKAKVVYSIQVEVELCLPNGSTVHLKKSKPVCIVPKTVEAPPMLVEKGDPYFKLSQERCVRPADPKIRKMGGRLTASMSEQPSWVQRHPYGSSESTPETTALVDLRFHPANPGELPPKIDTIVTKLHSFTFFGALPFGAIPRPKNIHSGSPEHTHYVNTTRLQEHRPNAISWITSHPHDPVVTTDAHTQPELRYADHDKELAYQTSLRVPIRLPEQRKKATEPGLLTPTFSSCLISRIYSVEVKVLYSPAATLGSLSRYLLPRRCLVLKAPMQVYVGPIKPCSSSAATLQNSTLPAEKRQQADKILNVIAAEQPPPAYTRCYNRTT